MRDKSELKELFQKGTIEEMANVLYEIYEGEITTVEKEEIDDLLIGFNYSAIETAKYDQIKSLLSILSIFDCSNSEIHKNIVLRVIKDPDKLEDMIKYLICNDTLKILTKEELESLNLKKLSFTFEDEEELSTLPDSIGNIKNLEELDLKYAEYLRNLPKSILQLKNLKIVRLPSWSKSFKLPQWIDQLSWIEQLTFRISIVDIEKIFDLKDFFGIFTGPEIVKLYKELRSLQYRSERNHKIPYAILELLEAKLKALDDKALLRKTEGLLADFIDFIFKIIEKLRSGVRWDVGDNIRNNGLETIGKRFSSICKNRVKKIVKKGDDSEISEMLRNDWLELLTKEDLSELIKEEQLRFLKTIIDVESQWEYYGFGAKIDEVIFEYVLETVPPNEALFLKELDSLLNKRIIIVFKWDLESQINAIELKNHHIVSLILRENSLEKLPESIGNLQSIESLDVDHTNLRELPKSIGKLKNLKWLRISDCKITELPEEIGMLTRLKSLEMWSNKLSSLPKSIGNLESLEVLDLFGNCLKDISESIGGLKSLETLGLGANLFITLPDSIANIKSLNEFDVQQNPSLVIPDKLKFLVEDYYDFGASMRLIFETGSYVKDRTALKQIEKFPLQGKYGDWKQKLEAVLTQYRLSSHTNMILNAVRDRIIFEQDSVINEAISNIGLGRSKLGGLPDVPSDFTWPRWKGRPLDFLMQINLSDLRDFVFVPPSLKHGFLYFFFDPLQEDWGVYYPENKEAWRVIYADEDRSNLVRKYNPSHGKNQKVRACKVYFHRDIHLPSQTIHLFETMRGDNFTWAELGDIDSDFIDLRYKLFKYDNVDNNHALFGYPDMIQEGPHLSDWVHLLQLGSDDELKWLWGGYRARGKLHFYIKEEDLKKNYFENVHMILDCY